MIMFFETWSWCNKYISMANICTQCARMPGSFLPFSTWHCCRWPRCHHRLMSWLIFIALQRTSARILMVRIQTDAGTYVEHDDNLWTGRTTRKPYKLQWQHLTTVETERVCVFPKAKTLAFLNRIKLLIRWRGNRNCTWNRILLHRIKLNWNSLKSTMWLLFDWHALLLPNWFLEIVDREKSCTN